MNLNWSMDVATIQCTIYTCDTLTAVRCLFRFFIILLHFSWVLLLRSCEMRALGSLYEMCVAFHSHVSHSLFHLEWNVCVSIDAGTCACTCISTISNLNWFNLMCICLFCFPLAIGFFLVLSLPLAKQWQNLYLRQTLSVADLLFWMCVREWVTCSF